MDKLYKAKIVKEDLEYLRDNWKQDIDDSSLRIGSTILRRLLVEGCLSEAWRFAGFEKEPEILAPSLDKVIRGIPRLRINLASAGGATYIIKEARFNAF